MGARIIILLSEIALNFRDWVVNEPPLDSCFRQAKEEVGYS